MPSSIRAVLLDLGDTLMYPRRPWPPVYARADNALAVALRAWGLALDPQTFPQRFRQRLRACHDRRERDLRERTTTAILRALLAEEGHPNVPADTLRAALDAYYAITQANWTIEEDALPTLRTLHQAGYRLALLSNAGDHKDVLQLVERFGLAPYLDFAISSASCGYRKPHRRIFEAALTHWSVSPREAIMVGDTLEADILGANAMGIYSIWIVRRARSRPRTHPHIRPNAIIKTLSELPALLDKSPSGA